MKKKPQTTKIQQPNKTLIDIRITVDVHVDMQITKDVEHEEVKNLPLISPTHPPIDEA